MKLLKQTRMIEVNRNGELLRGNPLATVIACFLDLDSPEDAIQIQNHYPSDRGGNEASWVLILSHWLEERGYDWGILDGHLYNNEPYIVYGINDTGLTHVCIYKNGELLHDPLPDGEGLIEETQFEYIRKDTKTRIMLN